MTEQEWLNAAEPQRMLEFLRGKASNRKLRLFAVACCRRIWTFGTDARSREAVEKAERYADGLIDLADLVAVYAGDLNADPVYFSVHDNDYADGYAAGVDAAWTAHASAYHARHVVRYQPTLSRPRFPFWPRSDTALRQEQVAQCDLLRCIFGLLPYRGVPVARSWLTGTVACMAKTIYDDRAFDRMPILGDALEEAGCSDRSVLDHSRGSRPHVRGCWVLDAILGRE